MRGKAQPAARLGAPLVGRPPRATLAGGRRRCGCPPEGSFAGAVSRPTGITGSRLQALWHSAAGLRPLISP